MEVDKRVSKVAFFGITLSCEVYVCVDIPVHCVESRYPIVFKQENFLIHTLACTFYIVISIHFTVVCVSFQNQLYLIFFPPCSWRKVLCCALVFLQNKTYLVGRIPFTVGGCF